jgi:hypothetical protein
LNAEPVLPVTVRNVEATLKGRKVQLSATGEKGGGKAVRKPSPAARCVSSMTRRRSSGAFAHSSRNDELDSGRGIGARSPGGRAFGDPRPRTRRPRSICRGRVPTGRWRSSAYRCQAGVLHRRADEPAAWARAARAGKARTTSPPACWSRISRCISSTGARARWYGSPTLDRGKPVSGARVTVRDCRASSGSKGKPARTAS